MAETLITFDNDDRSAVETFWIGDWLICPQTNTAERGQDVRRLESRAVAVLSYLKANQGRVVGKNELLDAVWQKAAISEHSVAVVISDLRRALGDDSRSPRYIQTIPRRGYSLIAEDIPTLTTAPPSTLNEPSAPVPPPAANAPIAVPGFTDTQASAPNPPRWQRFLGDWRLGAALLVLVCMGLSTLLLERQPPSPHIAPTGVAMPASRGPFTTLEERPVHPAFSPDGGQVAFAWNEQGGRDFDIFVKPLGSQAMLRLTDTDHFDTLPVWSPKGNQIAFLRRDYWSAEPYCGVHVVSAVGGADRRLANCALPGRGAIDWMPNGDWLIFTDYLPETKSLRLMRLSVQTLETHPLTNPPLTHGGDDMAAISPDGRYIAFRRRRTSFMGDLYLLELDDAMNPVGDPKRLTYDGHLVSDIDWSPDGSHVIFSSGRRGFFRLWQVPVTGGEPVETIQTSTYIHGSALSPDGKTLILDQRDEATNLIVDRIAPPGTPSTVSEADLANPKKPAYLLQTTRFEWDADFSPDASKIVFLSDRSGALELWTINTDGTQDRQITTMDGPLLDDPRWSPTGNSIVFTVSRDANMDIYTVSPEGGPLTRHTTHAALDGSPAWSSDGRTVYFASDRTGRFEIWALDVASGRTKQITSDGGRYVVTGSDPSIIYVQKSSDSGIWEVAADGSGRETRIAQGLAPDARGYWEINGPHLYYLARLENQALVLRRRPLEGIARNDNDETLLALPEGVFHMQFKISPDHERVLYSALSRYRAQLYRVDLDEDQFAP